MRSSRLSLWHENGDALNRWRKRINICLDVTNQFHVLSEEKEMIEACKKLSLRKNPALILLIWVTGLSGCATFGFKTPEPVTVGEVIQMSKDNVPPETIVKKMRDSESVYPLTAAQLAELHDMGVSDRVLNYMQQTYIEAQRREQSLDDWGSGYMSGPGFW